MNTDRLSGTPVAGEMLGEEHPLVCALADVETAGRQLAVVTTAAGVALLAIAMGRSWGPALAVGAGIVALILAGRLMLAIDTSRQQACEVIIAGRDWLPIAVVQAQRRRLLDGAGRERLARSYEDLGQAATHSARHVAALLPFATPDIVAAVGQELTSVGSALRSQDANVRGVALAERLLGDGDSPLYGVDLDGLRRELRRVAWHLAVGDPGAGSAER